MKDIRVASVQMEHADGAKRANLDKIRTFTSEAAKQGVEMIVFPEFCITGCWFLRKLSRDQLEALAEPVFDGPSTQALLAQVRSSIVRVMSSKQKNAKVQQTKAKDAEA